jgi:hypothetical protein
MELKAPSLGTEIRSSSFSIAESSASMARASPDESVFGVVVAPLLLPAALPAASVAGLLVAAALAVVVVEAAEWLRADCPESAPGRAESVQPTSAATLRHTTAASNKRARRDRLIRRFPSIPLTAS